ncbi:histidine kinase [Fusobacterium polymorphum]|uniref:Histidine kinase n=1 Tax=Fusobacterium nucleatum subsp. polymorphum TaxID=76857 RepID=A0A2C6C1F6_FUSNP|nr:histidine kinase [Fusobacterium polymorphum]
MENVTLKFVILVILEYNIYKTLATEYIRLRLVNSILIKYLLFYIFLLKYSIQI